MFLSALPKLPILDCLPELLSALEQRNELVLEAPPGAGKTTCVPLALLDASWLGDGIILVLEPRRIAARSAADRMANLLGEKVGGTVGYRIRLDSCVGPQTKIEVITEGVLIRRLQSDPSLEGVAAVVFDEFHERSLDADLGLALCLQGRDIFREASDPLKLVVMSATLDGAAVAELISDDAQGAAPIVRSVGRAYPVELIYSCKLSKTSMPFYELCASVVAAINTALTNNSGGILVFLPGRAEIQAVLKQLQNSAAINSGVELSSLYGDLSVDAQRRVIAPAKAGVRKLVLATAIAETSLTVDGVEVIIDSGLSRLSHFDPASAMSRLHTVRLSKAASAQRAGRAGRLAPGVCYRLWSESQQGSLQDFTPPEILQADLTPLALQLICWGVGSPDELRWLNTPSPAHYTQSLELLRQLGVVSGSEGQYQLTSHGKRVAALPLHPRLSHMLVRACELGLKKLGCDIAAILSERDPLSSRRGSVDDIGCDIEHRLMWLRDAKNSHGVGQRKRLQRQSKQYTQMCSGIDVVESVNDCAALHWAGLLLAFAYPDRIAQKRLPKGAANLPEHSLNYRLSNGRSVVLAQGDALGSVNYLACSEVGGRQGDSRDRVYMAASLDVNILQQYLPDLLSTRDQVRWDDEQERFVAQRQQCLGALVVKQEALKTIDPERKGAVLCALIRERGLQMLPWTPELKQWCARIELIRPLQSDADWPNVSEQALRDVLELWLAPYLNEVRHIDDFNRVDLKAALQAQLPWPLPNQLDELVPERFKVPSGSRIAIDYTVQPPVLAVRLQEMFGCVETPSVAGKQVKLLVHLLSPAKRPLQVTQDLAGFWSGSYEQVKKDMKGRYPKHFWPDNPLECAPTARVKHPKKR